MGESFVGVKFETSFVGKEAPADPRLAELKEWCRRFSAVGLTPPNDADCASGNLSFRTASGFVITGSGLKSKGEIGDECFVEVLSIDLERSVVSVRGTREPSSEAMLHSAIYSQREDVNAVFHGHSSRMLDCAGRLEAAVTERADPYGSMALVESVLEILDRNNFLILKNHGFVSLGATMEEAGNLALEMLSKCGR